MKTLAIALGLTLAASTAALADGSTARDAVLLPQDTAAVTAQAPIAETGVPSNLQLGISPRASGPSFDGGIDYTATASIGATADVSSNGYVNLSQQPRLGDGVRAY
ncbi:hypothetical protein [Pseudohoeflea coraliihabitans]|uniref:Uncharacterized protein n=1 Tax=Pseudohoeflea coraliihabitans TaxID=2860393 RepID=A0ABS6WM48_9HYPH|nr:hypothetical protein [Pseudohoeflea sp. DP4N28-3]MBW3096860.1 hypothetical protein [Pseudohoeflea sp. DP4N28-3]